MWVPLSTLKRKEMKVWRHFCAAVTITLVQRSYVKKSKHKHYKMTTKKKRLVHTSNDNWVVVAAGKTNEPGYIFPFTY